MILTHKLRLYLTHEQEQKLLALLDACRELYNAALEHRIVAWKHRVRVTCYDQQKEIPLIKLEREELRALDAASYRYPLRRLDRAFQSFFRRVKSGETPGFPRFKGRNRYDSVDYPQGFKVINKRLRLSKIGDIKARGWRDLGEAKIKHITVKRSGTRWYAYLVVEAVALPLPVSSESIGIDVGLSHFATLSDGTGIENPRFYVTSQAQLRVSQRRVARTIKGSARRRTTVQQLRAVHERIANQRNDFHHKLSRQLVNRYGVLAVEDLNVKGMASGMLAKQVNDAGWSSFLSKLSYKAENAGRRLVKVNPRGSSQTCVCGASVPKELKDRWHECPSCGLSLPRDHVSALVIIQRARLAPSGVNVEVPISCVA